MSTRHSRHSLGIVLPHFSQVYKGQIILHSDKAYAAWRLRSPLRSFRCGLEALGYFHSLYTRNGRKQDFAVVRMSFAKNVIGSLQGLTLHCKKEKGSGSWLNTAEDRQFEPLEVAVCMQEADLAKPLDLHFKPLQNIVSLIGTTAVFRIHKRAVSPVRKLM